MDEYKPVAESKRAGEDALDRRDSRTFQKGISWSSSADMIEGTVTKPAEPPAPRRY